MSFYDWPHEFSSNGRDCNLVALHWLCVDKVKAIKVKVSLGDVIVWISLTARNASMPS